MNILINASNLRVGGGLQVADSISRELFRYSDHEFTVVLPETMRDCAEDISKYPNVDVRIYNLPLDIGLILSGRDKFMDGLVAEKNIEGVLTVFGPSRWKPEKVHVCGFAMPHLVLGDSPYWGMQKWHERMKNSFRYAMMRRDFRRNPDVLWTENEYISEKVRKRLGKNKVHTVTNNYNQIFDRPEEWDNSIVLPDFNGLTLFTVCANYPHKNLRISVDAMRILKSKYPDLKLRFVFSVTEESFGGVPEDMKENFIFLGSVSLRQLPGLYKQADVMFLPSLLECFSASYAEAMRMDVPILTTDLGFAHSLCEEAAEYYSAVDPAALAGSIAALSRDEEKRRYLAAAGRKQLAKFDTFKTRAEKLIRLMEETIRDKEQKDNS